MRVALLHNGPSIRPESTIVVKNLAVANAIAGMIDGEVCEAPVTDADYYVPFEAVDTETANKYGIQPETGMYGGLVEFPEHADKAVLHTPVNADSSEHPEWYKDEFAKRLRAAEATLPGFTVFSLDETAEAVTSLQADGLIARLKDPSERCARGQVSVSSVDEAVAVVSGSGDNLATTGLVVEASLDLPVTIAVGYLALGGTAYSWYGQTWDTFYEGEVKFGGNQITIVKGDFEVLGAAAHSRAAARAVEQAGAVAAAYPTLGSVVTRATFDVVQGFDGQGRFWSGVTDPSIRPSASSPVELYAANVLADRPEGSSMHARLTYDYGHRIEQLEPEMQLFAASAKVGIYVQEIEKAMNCNN